MRVDAKHAGWTAPCAAFALTVSFILYIVGNLVRHAGNWTFDVIASRHNWDRAEKAQCCVAASRFYLVLGVALTVLYVLSTRDTPASRTRDSSFDGRDAEEAYVPSRQANYESTVRARLRAVAQLLRAGGLLLYNRLRRLIGWPPVRAPRPRHGGAGGGLRTRGDISAPDSSAALFADSRHHTFSEMDRLDTPSAESTRPTTPTCGGIDPVRRLRAWLQRDEHAVVRGETPVTGPQLPARRAAHTSAPSDMTHPPGHARHLADHGGGRRRRGVRDGQMADANSLMNITSSPSSPVASHPMSGLPANASVEDLVVPLPPSSP